MTLIDLRCPACNAPVDASHAAVRTCRYCGATLVQASPLETPVVAAVALPDRGVRLEDSGSVHITVIKTVRDYLGLGLGEAKHLIDTAPCVLTPKLEGARAKSFVDALVAAGAKATLF